MFKYDVSIPLQHYYDLVPKLRERLGSKATRVFGYGHIGKCLKVVKIVAIIPTRTLKILQ